MYGGSMGPISGKRGCPWGGVWLRKFLNYSGLAFLFTKTINGSRPQQTLLGFFGYAFGYV
jgi:hypothetical protein